MWTLIMLADKIISNIFFNFTENFPGGFSPRLWIFFRMIFTQHYILGPNKLGSWKKIFLMEFKEVISKKIGKYLHMGTETLWLLNI